MMGLSRWAVSLSLLLLSSFSLGSTLQPAENSTTTERFLKVNRCSGPGCPYMGAWLAHSDLFMKAAWNLASRKMEEATFNMFPNNVVFQTEMEHHVKHMSAFEHSVNNVGAKNGSEIISAFVNAAYDGECDDITAHPVASNEYLALIPFYGGMPPSASKTIENGIPTNGEGHSKISPLLKAYTCMATICSCLKYFGRVVVGVTSDNDEDLLNNELKGMDPLLARRVNVLRFEIPRPSALPFHVLTWGQRFVMHHNCKVRGRHNITIHGHKEGELGGNCDLYKKGLKNIKNIQAEHRFVKHQNRTMHFPVNSIIQYVYYTESDEIVYFNDQPTLEAISKGSNKTCMFLGRRAERAYDPRKASVEPPEEYLKFYHSGRYCGQKGFELSFQDNMVRKVQ